MDHLSTGQIAELACRLEVAAPKVGNVHTGADFADMTYGDFVASAQAIREPMDHAVQRSVGETVLAAVEATRRVVATNTNLGTVLLLAPLCAVQRGIAIAKGLSEVLSRTTKEDAGAVYRAIRLAAPSGLGHVDEADVEDAPTQNLVAIMKLAADRDLVARQYANGFQEVLQIVAPRLGEPAPAERHLLDRITSVQLRLMAELPDSFIARKCGAAVAEESAARAGAVLASGAPGSSRFREARQEFDRWLRADGNRRNPGTTADLIAAGLFVGLRDGIIEVERDPQVARALSAMNA